MPIKDLAICLRRSDYSETSLVLRMMTRTHGQVALMAKGVKRPKSRFGGAIDLLAVGEAVFTLPRENSVSTLGTLTGWEQTAYHPLLRTDLLRHATAMLAGELLARLTEERDPHPASFDAMARLLDELAAGDPPLRRLAVFGRSLLADVGLSPAMDRCASCGSAVGAGKAVYSGRRGGVLCASCPPSPGESTKPVSAALRGFFTADQAPDGKLALEIARWLIYHVQDQIGRELAMAAPLEHAISSALARLKAQS